MYREFWPRRLRIVEIGVFRGDNAARIHNVCDPAELWLVDHWKHVGGHGKRGKPKSFHDQAYLQCKWMARSYPNVNLLKWDDVDSSRLFPDGYFDIAYLDSYHAYDSVRAALIAWWPKVKWGFFGHDYFNRGKFFQVKRAVDEFFPELDFITQDADASWGFLRRPDVNPGRV